MPSISSCPACHRDITIPSDVARQRRLRCPLCDAQFLAEAVLAASTPAPPEVLLEDAVGESASLLAFGARLDDIVGGARFWNTSPEATEPNAGFTLDGTTSESTGNRAEAHAMGRSETQVESKSGEMPPDAAEAPESPLSGDAAEASHVPQWDPLRDEFSSTATDDRATDAELADDEDGAITDEDEIVTEAGDELVESPVGSFNIASKPRSKPGGIGIFGHFLGVIGGGVIGLALGYYVLLCIGGARVDFLEIRDKIRWLLPRERGENPSNDDTSELPQQQPRKARHGEQQRIAAPSTQTPKTGQIVLAGGTTDPAESGFEAERAIGQSDPLAPSETRPLGPTQFTAHTPDELAAALASVSGELGCEHCGGTGIVRRMAASGESPGSNSPGSESPGSAGQPGSRAARQTAGRRALCEHCDGKPSGKLTLDLFDQLCELAEVATFTRVEPSQPDWERLRNEAQRILFRIGNDHDKAQIAGRLAGPRLDDSRRLSNGIVLAGTVHDAGEEGALFRTRLVLFGRPITVTVMSLHAPTPPLAKHDHVIVLGSIIDSPRDNLGGYVGSLPQVVWGGLALKLD
ncbi:MAG TPA: hypothetical protein VND64_08725 [Pirellulales bacterium]|nr:hypothetical protein [Pirellulales bacterium]